MNLEVAFFIANAVTIGTLLLSIIYTAGVVWRVEMKLDVSYKFFLAGVIFLFAAEILDLYYPIDNATNIAVAIKILRMLFAICFLFGVLFVRKILRDIDGEK